MKKRIIEICQPVRNTQNRTRRSFQSIDFPTLAGYFCNSLQKEIMNGKYGHAALEKIEFRKWKNKRIHWNAFSLDDESA